MGAFSRILNTLTLDTDESRANQNPGIVRDLSGRTVAVYSKRFKSGRLSDSRVLFTLGTFDIQVGAGNGVINGISVSWGATAISASPNTYSIIYVDTAGTVRVSGDIPMSLYQNSIILAYANCGDSSIVAMEEVEKDGYYIFLKKQVLSGTTWVWDGYEYRLNGGRDPSITYDAAMDKAWISYHKDGSAFTRVVELGNPLTFEFIRNYEVISGTVYLSNALTRNVTSFEDSGPSRIFDIPIELFSFNPISLSIKKIAGVRTPFVSTLIITGSYTSSMVGTQKAYYYTKAGSVYTVEQEGPADTVIKWYPAPYPWFQWAGTYGDKYVGLEIKHNLYNGTYLTDPSLYRIFNIRVLSDVITLAADTYTADIIDITYDRPVCDLGNSTVVKTAEQDQTFMARDGGLEDAFVDSGVSITTKTFEFDQIFDMSDGVDSTDAFVDSGRAIVTKTFES